MMTSKQRFHLCVDLWGRVCKAQNWDPRDSDKRHEIYQSLCDQGRIHAVHFRDFTQADFDEVKATFLALIGDDIAAQVRQINQPRKRRIASLHAYARVAYPHNPFGALNKICKSKFNTNNLDDLTDAQVAMLQYTLARAAHRNTHKPQPDQPDEQSDWPTEPDPAPASQTADCPF